MKRIVFVAIAGIALIALVAGPATAHKKKITTTAIIALADVPGDDSIIGEVKAASNCEKDRTVQLFYTGPTGVPELVGQTVTDQEGDWAIALGENAKKGTYTATVFKHKEVRGKHVHRCLATVSNALITE